MRIKRALLAVAVAVCGLGAAAAPAVATTAPYCRITWGSQARSGGTQSTAPLITTRTGQHDCYDRVVFEVDGPTSGYRVDYAEAYTEGQGVALSPYTAGGALLNVVLLNPTYDLSGSVRYDHATGDHPQNVLGYRTLRDVVFGGSFEGYTTFAVGVRARLPYRVTILAGPGTHSRIVLDVAHAW